MTSGWNCGSPTRAPGPDRACCRVLRRGARITSIAELRSRPLPRAYAAHVEDGGVSLSPDRPELADIGRLARRLVRRTIAAARADESSVGKLLAAHLGAQGATLPVATGSWPSYDQVNVQTAVDIWLAEPGRTHHLVGLTDCRHSDFALADLLQDDGWGSGIGIGSVETQAIPAGPDGETRQCVQCAIYLTTDPDGAAALLVRAEDGVEVQVVCTSPDRAQLVIDEIRRLGLKHNVFRGHVVEFGGEVFGHRGGALLSFVSRPDVARDQVVLPPDVLDGIERQVVGVARHASRLLASGQHLRRGVLLYGPPGTGKTHTVRYLLSKLQGVTAVLLSGSALGLIAEACSVARALQPSVIVAEDVDLIAEERGRHPGRHPLLFQLLNEMDGLGSDIDVTFLLTTNRADLLEQALAARPGRVDHAAELAVPDAAARSRLLRLYQGRLKLNLSDPESVITRTEGVTASFIKELLRRAALVAAEEDNGTGEVTDAPITVTDGHLSVALDELLDTRSRLTQALLGGGPSERQQGQASL